MANIIHSAKSACDWTRNELLAYNIRVVNEDFNMFFSYPNMPPSTMHPDILNNVTVPPNPSKSTRLFFRYMNDAMVRSESAFDDFSAYLLTLIDFDKLNRVIHHTSEIGFVMCRLNVSAKLDISIEDEDYLLFVQEDKVSSS
jgi:hypothetical protein